MAVWQDRSGSRAGFGWFAVALAIAAAGCVDEGPVAVTGGNTAGNKDAGGVGADVAASDTATASETSAEDTLTADAVGPGDDATPTRVDVITDPDAVGGDGTVTPDDSTVQPEDSLVADSATDDAIVAPDVTPEDIAAPDATVVDAQSGDTALPDTTGADATQPDTAPADTTQPDLPPADVGPCGPAGCDDGNPCTIDTCKPDGLCQWTTQANTPCDDGDKCTTGDTCVGLQCKAGTGKADCDDKNPCTTDSCGAASGCIHAPATANCDDGDKCTLQDKCTDGACKGGQGACDDGKPCTVDACDKATGNCSWTGSTAACDDGNACTVNEACKAGSCGGGEVKACDDKDVCSTDSCDPKSGCVYTPTANGGKCDDGTACTANDACSGGKCTGAAAACDDGNVCTSDGCDPKTGQCTLTSNTLPCQGGDKCQAAGTCKNGSCAASGAPKVCNDSNPCTADSCEAGSGACVYKAANDGAVCDDGIACTKESVCAGGGCKPKAGCLVFADSFECGAQPTFTVAVPPPTPPNPPRKVFWAVDQTPVVTLLAGMGCSLNFNDGVDYCDQIGFNDGTLVCQLPVGTATSPLLDFKVAPSLAPLLTFDTYYDVDNFSQTDSPRLRVIEDGTNTLLKEVVLPKNNGDLKTLKKGYMVPMAEAQGKKVRIELSLQPSSQNSSTGNTGTGWYVDNVKVELVTGNVEICGNGLDDNFNGFVDCADTACAAQAACAENCGDSIDNNKNGLVDCQDAACAQTLACKAAFATSTLDACDGNTWTFAAAVGGVAWALDASPDIGALPFGKCTVNFNNGKNYCHSGNCQSGQGTSGIATYKPQFDLPAGKKLTLMMQTWLSTENPNQGQGANYDNTWVEVSANNFACNNGNNCPSQGNPYTQGQTVSYQLPRDKLKVWVQRQMDLGPLAGKKVSLRVRFSSGDGKFNDFEGPFLDEFKFYAE